MRSWHRTRSADQPHERQSCPSGGAARAREGSLHACAETPALFSWPAARSRGRFFGRAIEPDQPRTSVRGWARPCRRCRLTSGSNGKSVKRLEAPIVLLASRQAKFYLVPSDVGRRTVWEMATESGAMASTRCGDVTLRLDEAKGELHDQRRVLTRFGRSSGRRSSWARERAGKRLQRGAFGTRAR